MDQQQFPNDNLVTFIERSLKIYQVEASLPAIYVTMEGLTQEEIKSVTKCIYELHSQSTEGPRLERDNFSQRIYWEQLPIKAGDWFRVKIILERGSLPSIIQHSNALYAKQLLLEHAEPKRLQFTAIGYGKEDQEYLLSTTVSIHVNNTVHHQRYDDILTDLNISSASYPSGAKVYGVFTYRKKSGAADDKVVSNTITIM